MEVQSQLCERAGNLNELGNSCFNSSPRKRKPFQAGRNGTQGLPHEDQSLHFKSGKTIGLDARERGMRAGCVGMSEAPQRRLRILICI